MYLLSLKNTTIYKPYAIFIDHKLKAIIITIKGTSSKDDVITDFNCDPQRVLLTIDRNILVYLTIYIFILI